MGYTVRVNTRGIQGNAGGSVDFASPGAAIGSTTPVPTGSKFVDMLLIKTSTITSSTDRTLGASLTVTPSGTSSATHQGVLGSIVTTGAASMSSAVVVGMSGTVSHDNTNTLGYMIGASGSVTTTAGNVTNAHGVQAIVNNTGSGTISGAHGVHVYSATNTGGGALTANVGVYVESQTAGSSNYAIYTNTGAVRFGDTVTIASGNLALSAGVITLARTNTATSGTVIGISPTVTVSPTGASSGSSYGLWSIVQSFSAQNITGSLRAFLGTASWSGTGTLTSAYGGFMQVTLSDVTGDINNVYGAYTAVSNASTSSGVMGNVFMYYASTPTATGQITNAYGVYVADINTATTLNYAIYTNAGTVRIGGTIDHDGSSIGLFGATPTTKPTVTGSRGGNAALASLLTGLATLGLITDSSS